MGQTTKTVEQRKQKHFQEVRSESNGKRKSSYFHNALKKYGEEAFEFKQIDEASDLDELNEKEAFWIKVFRSTEWCFGYNLDSGGKNCMRHPSTIEKLRVSTQKLIAENEDYRESAINGLKKGTESWKKICKSNRIKLTCPVCNIEFYLPPNEAKKRTYCSVKCAKIGNKQKSIENARLATAQNMNLKAKRNKEIAKVIYKWAFQHQSEIMNCPLNNISSTLADLRLQVFEKFGVSDWRTIGDSVGHMYRKDFVNHLKEFLNNENICCSSPN